MNRRASRLIRRIRLHVCCSLLLAMLLGTCSRLPTGPVSPTPLAFKGITIVSWSAREYESATTANQVAWISSTGASHLAILMTAYQAQSTSDSVRAFDSRTPSNFAIRRCAEMAANQNLAVAFKPQINIDDGSWSGEIDPSNPEKWFRSYRDLIIAQAELAESVGAALFIVGTELGHTLQFEADWRSTIAEVRTVFSGEVTYAASWDEAEQVPFWDVLDYVGINFYYPVASRKNPGRMELLAGWQPWLARMNNLHKNTGKPVLLTEIGYRSIDGAGMIPSDFASFGEVDLEEQANLYWAALEAVSSQSFIVGIFWWNWLARGSGSYNTEYSPAGKPAESIIREAWVEVE